VDRADVGDALDAIVTGQRSGDVAREPCVIPESATWRHKAQWMLDLLDGKPGGIPCNDQ
jgi:hypothetical protein